MKYIENWFLQSRVYPLLPHGLGRRKHGRRSRPQQQSFGRARERYHVCRVLWPLPGGQAAPLQSLQYYCRACIESLAKRTRGRPFPCPECHKDATLPLGGVEQLQSAFFVERMKDVYKKMAKVEGKVEAVCEQCSKGKSVAFCRHVYRLHLRRVQNTALEA